MGSGRFPSFGVFLDAVVCCFFQVDIFVYHGDSGILILGFLSPFGGFGVRAVVRREPGEQVVSPAAEVTCQRRTEEDEFLILGTDGVWDVLSNQVR